MFDHGLLYGDGIFEGIRAYNGRVFKLKEHIDRLFYSAKAILLGVPLTHQQVCDAVLETCRQNKIRDGYIRLVVTRGPGGLGLNPNKCKQPSVIVIADKIQLYAKEVYERGMDIITVPTVRNLHSALNPAIKSLNYLNNVLAKIEANLGVDKTLIHKPRLFTDRGPVIGYYAVIKYRDGAFDFEPMSLAQVDAIRDRADAWKAFKEGKIKSTPWATDHDEMSKKTAIKRLIKRAPQSPELSEAVRISRSRISRPCRSASISAARIRCTQ